MGVEGRGCTKVFLGLYYVLLGCEEVACVVDVSGHGGN